jgi:excisionase family DNA binding protein
MSISRKAAPDDFDPESLMTPAEVCGMLSISRKTLQRWCHSKPPKITYIRLSASEIRFRRQLIDFFLQQREIAGVYHLPEAAGTPI